MSMGLAMNTTTLKLPAIKKVDKPIQKTEYIYPDQIAGLLKPQFQRPLIINEDVIEMARAMQREAAGDRDHLCEIPGQPLEFGRLRGEEQQWLLDGQHRTMGSFALACGKKVLDGGLALETEGGVQPKVAVANIIIRTYNTMAEMAEAFRNFQKKLVTLKPDDALRAAEESNPQLRRIREECPFLGYEKNKNTKTRIMMSMSAAIRTWFGSGATPTNGPNADKAEQFLRLDDGGEARAIIAFFRALEAAGWVDPDPKFNRLWGTLNVGINMWLWRKLVLGTSNKFHGGGSFMSLTAEQYVECAKELKDPEYMRDLQSRSLRYQDRVPTYDKIKELFAPALARLKIVGPRYPLPQGWE